MRTANAARSKVIARLYAGLGQAFDDPEPCMLQLSPSHPVLNPLVLALNAGTLELEASFDGLWTCVRSKSASLDEEYEALVLEHTRLFYGLPRALVSPYAHSYLSQSDPGDRPDAMVSMLTTAGLRTTGDFRDLPDHICVALELMGQLLDRGATRNADQFRRRHLQPFALAFIAEVQQHTKSEFYVAATEVLRRVVNLDLSRDEPRSKEHSA